VGVMKLSATDDSAGIGGGVDLLANIARALNVAIAAIAGYSTTPSANRVVGVKKNRFALRIRRSPPHLHLAVSATVIVWSPLHPQITVVGTQMLAIASMH
jgi:hypothetical protein